MASCPAVDVTAALGCLTVGCAARERQQELGKVLDLLRRLGRQGFRLVRNGRGISGHHGEVPPTLVSRADSEACDILDFRDRAGSIQMVVVGQIEFGGP